jgi:hypothetical protein
LVTSASSRLSSTTRTLRPSSSRGASMIAPLPSLSSLRQSGTARPQPV